MDAENIFLLVDRPVFASRNLRPLDEADREGWRMPLEELVHPPQPRVPAVCIEYLDPFLRVQMGVDVHYRNLAFLAFLAIWYRE